MELYIVRHGETDWNKLKRFQGNIDIELNEKTVRSIATWTVDTSDGKFYKRKANTLSIENIYDLYCKDMLDFNDDNLFKGSLSDINKKLYSYFGFSKKLTELIKVHPLLENIYNIKR